MPTTPRTCAFCLCWMWLLAAAGVSCAYAEEAVETAPNASDLINDADQNRPSEPLTFSVFGNPLVIGGEVSLDLDYREDYRLSRRARDDVGTFILGHDLEFLYSWGESWIVFTEWKFNWSSEVYRENDDTEDDGRVRRGQAWVSLKPIARLPLRLQIGRQKFRDRREWWWNERLDGVSLRYNSRRYEFMIGVAEEQFEESPEQHGVPVQDDGIFRVFLNARFQWMRRHYLSAFYLRHRDHSGLPATGEVYRISQQDLIDLHQDWFGLRLNGEWRKKRYGRITYWGDLGYTHGTEWETDFDNFSTGFRVVDDTARNPIEGHALDIGISYRLPRFGRLTLTAKYALASGRDGNKQGFTPTSLEDNNGRFGGVNRFRYYGELLRPDLVNIRIASFGVGARFWRKSSFELMVHDYRQDEVASDRRVGNIRVRPNGLDRHIGNELDATLGIEDFENIEIEVIASYFASGSAYANRSDRNAWRFIFSVDYNF